MRTLITLASALLLSANCYALSITELSNGDAANGLKAALDQGARLAVGQLSKPGGFADDPHVRIELPGKLGKAAKTMQMMGMDVPVDQLEASLNQAAEAAMPQAQSILLGAIEKMTLTDAKQLLSGGDDAATQYLNRSSREQIRAKLLPLIKGTTDQIPLTQQYNNLVDQVGPLGGLDNNSRSVEGYVTEQALNGLFEVMAVQEKNLRANPAQAGSALLKKVFSAQ